MSSVGKRHYLDYNATAPLLAAARDAFVDALDLVGNPSSVHAEGRRTRGSVERSRREVAALVGASADTVIFTASATEAAATCLTPYWFRDGAEHVFDRLAVIDTDHPAIRDGGRFPADRVARLPVDAEGRLDLRSLEAWLRDLGGGRAMLALCLANGETGVLQPLAAIRERLCGKKVALVLDGVQAAGRMPLDIASLGADALILSGHKIGGAKGAGALVLGREGLRPFRLIPGGGQEHGLRSGTEAVPAIASFGAAAMVAADRAGEGQGRLAVIRDRAAAVLRDAGCVLLGEGAERLANTLSIAMPGVKAETAQIALDLDGFAVSAGSACSSGKVGASHVLAAMAAGGLDVDPALGLLRISFGADTAEEELDLVAAAVVKIVGRARSAKGSLRAA